jgi:DNA invertase Pin-like site-specific DNA recombinase
MGRVVAYTRVSTREQADSGLGLAAQRQRLTDETVRREWLDVRWVADEGVSAKVPASARPNLGPELAAMGAGDVLVVAKLDRLSRSVHDFASLLARAEREGWAVAALDLGIDTTTPTGELIAHMVVAVAQWERRMIGLRTREGLAETDKPLGRPKGRPKTGGRTPSPIPPQVAAVVRDAACEGLSPTATAARLNEYGLKSLRGKRWHPESVRRLVDRLAAEDAGAADTITSEEVAA